MPSDSFGNIMCVLQLLFYSILIFSFLILLKYCRFFINTVCTLHRLLHRCAHFAKLGAPLKSLGNYPTVSHQMERFLRAVFSNYSIIFK